MSDLHETIVREFFERQGFFARFQRRYSSHGEEEIELLVMQPQHKGNCAVNSFVLAPADLAAIPRAVVAIRPWHTETFSQARLAGAPEILRFIQPNHLRRLAAVFGSEEPLCKIMVLPALPAGKAAREEAIAHLKNKGVDAVLLFQTVLTDLVESVEINRSYQKSDLLQILRVLKNYDLLKDRQLELFRGRRRKQKS